MPSYVQKKVSSLDMHCTAQLKSYYLRLHKFAAKELTRHFCRNHSCFKCIQILVAIFLIFIHLYADIGFLKCLMSPNGEFFIALDTKVDICDKFFFYCCNFVLPGTKFVHCIVYF